VSLSKGVVHEAALIFALRSKQIVAAGLEVLAQVHGGARRLSAQEGRSFAMLAILLTYQAHE
jgi:hypothetical protein